MFGEITINKLVEQTDKQLTEAINFIAKAYIIADKLNKNNDNIDTQSILVYIGEAFGIIKDWQNYYHKFNNVITGKTESDNEEIVKLRREIEMLNKELENKTLQEVKINKIVETLQDTLDTINKNAQLIASSKGNREKQKSATGSNSNRFIQELDTEKLIEIYKNNGYSITKEVKEYYNRQYGITYNGLRERLIKAGVWKSRN